MQLHRVERAQPSSQEGREMSFALFSSSQSPIDRLPNELLGEIFTLATHWVRSRPAQEALVDPNSTRMPALLGAVCCRWRMVSHNTSSLYTNIVLSIGQLRDLSNGATTLDTRGVRCHLHLSKRQPLRIVLDARDMYWDFSEPEIPSQYEYSTYVRPFTPAHMQAALSLLTPHTFRWKSLTILTDSWAPMHQAIQCINYHLPPTGAPLLENLTLMRCNEFVSHAPNFQPARLKAPAFLDLPLRSSPPQSMISSSDMIDLFPQIRNLRLCGVVVNWDRLTSSLQAASPTKLQTLEISHLSPDICPDIETLRNILLATPYLKELTIVGSGPLPGPTNWNSLMLGQPIDPVPLHHLESLSIGYRSILDALFILEIVSAPQLKSLSLEDANHVADSFDVAADRIFAYLCTGQVQKRTGNFVLAYASLDGSFTRMALQTGKNPFLERQLRKASGTGEDSERSSDPTDEGEPLHADRTPFPLLERLVLKQLLVCDESMKALYHALHHLKKIELFSLPAYAVKALYPIPIPMTSSSASTSTARYLCPCPSLLEVSIHGLTMAEVTILGPTIQQVVAERMGRTTSVKEVNVHIDTGPGPRSISALASLFGPTSASATANSNAREDYGCESHSVRVAQVSTKGGTLINVFGRAYISVYDEAETDTETVDDDGDSDSDSDSEAEEDPGVDDDDDDDGEDDEETAAYQLGGAFNDPLFDAFYAVQD